MCLHEPSVEMLVCLGEGDLARMCFVTLCAPFHVIALVCERSDGNYEHEEMVVHDLTILVHFLWFHMACMFGM